MGNGYSYSGKTIAQLLETWSFLANRTYQLLVKFVPPPRPPPGGRPPKRKKESKKEVINLQGVD